MAQLKRPKEVVFEYPQPPRPYPQSQRSGALIGPSGVGKTTTALAMLMGPYRNCYERVYVFSPSFAPGVDSAWDAWRKHVRTHMRVPDDEQTMWDTWEPKKLEALIERHKKVNVYLKAKKQNMSFAYCYLWTTSPMLETRSCTAPQTCSRLCSSAAATPVVRAGCYRRRRALFR